MRVRIIRPFTVVDVIEMDIPDTDIDNDDIGEFGEWDNCPVDLPQAKETLELGEYMDKYKDADIIKAWDEFKSVCDHGHYDFFNDYIRKLASDE